MSGRLQAAERLARSLQVKRQRGLLDSIGERLGTPVVYLKAAWSDPVLYGGRGERSGTDIDILVSRKARFAFADELARHGFRPERQLAHHLQRGWQMWPPDGDISVDLHAGIGELPWFPIDPIGLLKRSHDWDGVDGSLLALCTEDQVVHAVAHYAADRFNLDERHLGDIVRLLAARSVDWDAVTETCALAHMRIPLYIFAAMLRRRGARVPDIALPAAERSRLAALEAVFFSAPEARRFYTDNFATNVRIDLLFFFPLLSTRVTALPRLLTSAVTSRVRSAISHTSAPG